MPHDVQPFVNGLVENVAIFGMGGNDPLWQVVSNTVISFPTTVTTNTVVAIYRAVNGSIISKEIGMHRAERPLGLYIVNCGNPDCTNKNIPGHIMGELEKGVARIRCKTCKWKSKKVKVADNSSVITPLHTTKAPLLFYHTFPSPAELNSMFYTK